MHEDSTDQAHRETMDAHAVAQRLGVSVFTVKREVKRGALNFYRIGVGRGRLRFTEAQIQKYLSARENVDRVESSQK
jgi:excisionase family DNA binding protein